VASDLNPASTREARASAARRYPLGAALTADTLHHEPHPALAALREREPVSWVPALDGWLVTRYDLAVAVMRDPATFTVNDERFSTMRLVGASMLSLDGAEHDRHRAPFAAPFRPGIVRERFTAAVQAECDGLLADLAPRGAGDLRAQFAGPLAARVLARALGLDSAQAGEVRGAYEAIVAAVDALTAGRPLPEAGRRAHAALARRLAEAIGQGGEESLLAAAASAGDASRGPGATPLSAAELVANAVVLLFGGIDTTEGMVANALALLLTDPGVRREELDDERLERIIEESLRLDPAAAMVDRYATATTELAGASIAKGDLVHVSLTATGRDPAVFADPDRARLDAPRPRGHLAFAQGPHVCLGVHLARLETRIALRSVVAGLPGLRLDPDRRPSIRGLVFRKPDALHVFWERRPVTRQAT
jgi:cytochrome P450